jgi:hypothetical protein
LKRRWPRFGSRPMISDNALSIPVIPKGKKARGIHASVELAPCVIQRTEKRLLYLAMEEGQMVHNQRTLREGMHVRTRTQETWQIRG